MKAVKFKCLNCDTEFMSEKHPTLYCSELCQQEAKVIRYARSCIRDKRIERPDVLEAIQIRLAFIFGGGYSERERYLPKSIRNKVIAKYDGKCAQCGQPGTDIDHMSGNSNKIKDLQLLCKTCHNKKTKEGFTNIMPDDGNYIDYMLKRKELFSRIESEEPMKTCDDDINWVSIYKNELTTRRNILKTGT